MQRGRGWQWIGRDLTFALRQLRRERIVTVIALLTFALGIGANAAMLSVLRGVLVRPLPYPEPDRLAAIWPTRVISNGELVFLQAHATSFQSVAAFSPGWGVAMTGAGEPRQLDAARVSANFFDALGAQPRIGRGFQANESSPGHWNVVVLSQALWIAQFGADSATLGRTVDLDGQPYRVVGVMPEGFEPFAKVDAWLPLEIDPASPFFTGATALGFGRLRPGITVDRATSELATLAPQMRAAFNYTEDYARGATVTGLQDSLVGGVRRSVLVLYAAVALLMLIAVVNVGNLFLAHAVGRRREMAVRRALGGSKSTIVRQLLVQSVMLALLGGSLGVAIGAAGTAALRAFLGAILPRTGDIRLDVSVLVLSVVVIVAAGLAFGVGPALISSEVDPGGILRASALETGGHLAGRLRRSLVVAEVALATVLVVGASLMVVSLWRLGRVDLGFDPHGVATMLIQPSSGQLRSAADATPYFDEMTRRIAALPNVERVGAAQHLPLTGYNWTADLDIEGQPISATAAHPKVVWRSVVGDYFGTMRIPLLRGRLFAPTDARGAPPVVVINASMARRFWANRNPIGERIKLGNGPQHDWATIVGVVGDVRSATADAPAPDEVYRPNAQQGLVFMHFVIRTRGNPRAAMPSVRGAVRSLDQTVPIAQVRSLEDVSAASSASRRTIARLLSAFAALGLLLGATGIYGVVAYGVRRRTRELGIRSALGALQGRITTMVVGEALQMAGLGVAVGVAGAAIATRPLHALLYGVDPLSPAVYAAVACALLLVAAAAALAPARRAARVDPVVALRSD